MSWSLDAEENAKKIQHSLTLTILSHCLEQLELAENPLKNVENLENLANNRPLLKSEKTQTIEAVNKFIAVTEIEKFIDFTTTPRSAFAASMTPVESEPVDVCKTLKKLKKEDRKAKKKQWKNHK